MDAWARESEPSPKTGLASTWRLGTSVVPFWFAWALPPWSDSRHDVGHCDRNRARMPGFPIREQEVAGSKSIRPDGIYLDARLALCESGIRVPVACVNR